MKKRRVEEGEGVKTSVGGKLCCIDIDIFCNGKLDFNHTSFTFPRLFSEELFFFPIVVV